jgi:hypothetical protein
LIGRLGYDCAAAARGKATTSARLAKIRFAENIQFLLIPLYGLFFDTLVEGA